MPTSPSSVAVTISPPGAAALWQLGPLLSAQPVSDSAPIASVRSLVYTPAPLTALQLSFCFCAVSIVMPLQASVKPVFAAK